MTDKTGDSALDSIPNAVPNGEGTFLLPLIAERNDVILPHSINPIPADFDMGHNLKAAQFARDNEQTAIYVNQPKTLQPGDFLSQIERVATEVAIDYMSYGDGASQLALVQGRRRIEIIGIEQDTPFIVARAKLIAETIESAEQLELYQETVLDNFEVFAERVEYTSDEAKAYIFDLDDMSEQCDKIAAMLPLDVSQRQTLLNEVRLDYRFKLVNEWLVQELNAQDVRDDLNHQVEDEISRVQREIFLREQMRVIQQELGEEDIFDQELQELETRIIEANLPDEPYKQASKELQRLAIMSPMSPEASVVRTYIQWILDLPWHKASKDNLNLKHAEKVLEREHYGLEKVKERVLEHIAVRKLAGNEQKTPIICFVGPPGVGKTSLGKSIAEALGRKFIRVSLGGIRDEAEIRGHRRTYIGSLPGRIINTMKRAGTINPVLMLDEIDKMSEDYQGDPAAAMLEVLDPEQNHEFVDHYLEVPYDLSNVLFIATANDLYTLPEALEDRMEIIEFRGYTEEEKLEIAKRFLIPKQLKAHGLSRRGISFLDSATLTIIQHYTLEAGVRGLEREIANVCRKITRLAATKKKYPKRITSSAVERFLGAPYIIDSHINREDNIGLATGLVWTNAGGDIQVIEAALLPGKGSLMLTGSLGDVLQESAQIALTFMRSRAYEMDVPHDDFDSYDVHIHLPEGSVPKDGPSAGITLTLAIISVFTERKIRSDIAMTGEVTLRGHVLPVGGVKEKILGARRRGITNIILPADNEKDLQDVPKKALKDINITFARHMDDIIDIVLLPAPDERLRDVLSDEDDDDEDLEA